MLNVSIACPKACFISDDNFLRIPVNDGHVAKISPFFDIAYRFIGKFKEKCTCCFLKKIVVFIFYFQEKCRKSNSNVLIHCLAGISRSPTLAISYLMKYQSMKSDEAYK